MLHFGILISHSGVLISFSNVEKHFRSVKSCTGREYKNWILLRTQLLKWVSHIYCFVCNRAAPVLFSVLCNLNAMQTEKNPCIFSTPFVVLLFWVLRGGDRGEGQTTKTAAAVVSVLTILPFKFPIAPGSGCTWDVMQSLESSIELTTSPAHAQSI